MIGAFIAWSDRSNSPGYVIDGNGCHIWIGSTTPGGYGLVRVNMILQFVHRVRYEREIGPIPAGLDLDHYVCDNGCGACCNPHHCRPATRRENNLRGDGIASRNLAKRNCPWGHPLSGENLVLSGLRQGHRRCLVCHNQNAKNWRERQRQAAGLPPARPHRSRTHCPAGHELSGENLDPYTLKRGHRKCRVCMLVRQKVRRRVAA